MTNPPLMLLKEAMPGAANLIDLNQSKSAAKSKMAVHFTSKWQSRWQLPRETSTAGKHNDIRRRFGLRL
jgi:hypothetical protein